MRYQVKTYSINDPGGPPKITIPENRIVSDLRFTSSINGSNDSLVLEFSGDYTSSILQGDIVEIVVFGVDASANPIYEQILGSDTLLSESGEPLESESGEPLNVESGLGFSSRSGVPIYRGQINEPRIRYTSTSITTVIETYGLSSLLSDVLYSNGSSFTFSTSGDHADIVKSVIDWFQTKYSSDLIQYDDDSVMDTGVTTQFDAEYDSCLTVLERMAESSGYFFYIDPRGVISFKPKPIDSTHKLTFKYDVQELDLSLGDRTSIVNSYVVETTRGVIAEYSAEDTTSQSTYGFIQRYEPFSDTDNAPVVQETVDQFIQDNKDPTKSTNITVNSNYGIQVIRPGHTIQVRNINKEINNVLVRQVSFNEDFVTLTLEKIQTLGLSLLSK